jgi:DNA-binding NarL/FixJ family response regulator
VKARRRNLRQASVISVLVVAESAVRRAGLESLVKASPEFKLAGSCSHLFPGKGWEAHHAADVTLIDFDSAGSSAYSPESASHVVALVDEPDARWSAQALRSKVRAILPRDSSADQITAAIRAAHSGLVLLDARTAGELAQRVIVPRDEPSAPALDELTPREVEVLGLLAEGKANKEVASLLEISEHTVKFHISSILDKLGVSTRTEAVTTAIRAGLILL